MTCHVEEHRLSFTVLPDCVLDYGAPEDCTYAEELEKKGKNRKDCEYWKSNRKNKKCQKKS